MLGINSFQNVNNPAVQPGFSTLQKDSRVRDIINSVNATRNASTSTALNGDRVRKQSPVNSSSSTKRACLDPITSNNSENSTGQFKFDLNMLADISNEQDVARRNQLRIEALEDAISSEIRPKLSEVMANKLPLTDQWIPYLQNELQGTKTKAESSKDSIQTIERQFSDLIESHCRQEQLVQQLQMSLTETSQSVDQSRSESAARSSKLEESLAGQTSSLQTLDKQLGDVLRKTSTQEKQTQEVQSKLTELSKSVAQQRNESDSLSSKLESSIAEQVNFIQTLDKQSKEQAVLNQTISLQVGDVTRKITELKSDFQQLQNQLADSSKRGARQSNTNDLCEKITDLEMQVLQLAENSKKSTTTAAQLMSEWKKLTNPDGQIGSIGQVEMQLRGLSEKRAFDATLIADLQVESKNTINLIKQLTSSSVEYVQSAQNASSQASSVAEKLATIESQFLTHQDNLEQMSGSLKRVENGMKEQSQKNSEISASNNKFINEIDMWTKTFSERLREVERQQQQPKANLITTKLVVSEQNGSSAALVRLQAQEIIDLNGEVLGLRSELQQMSARNKLVEEQLKLLSQQINHLSQSQPVPTMPSS